MTATTIVIMIFSLIGLLIAANGIQQYKQKLNYERHQKLLKYAAIVLENEELLVNAVELPMSNTLISIILKRSLVVMELSIGLMPDSIRIGVRLKETSDHLASLNLADKTLAPLRIPNTDEHNAALIKTIKRLRYILIKQKKSGKLSHHVFHEEDRALAFFMVKIFVEYKIKQGDIALKSSQRGTAKQFYEKALKTLLSREKDGTAQYIESKMAEVREKLEAITAELLNTPDIRPDEPEDKDDLQTFFSQTKKKW